MLAGSGAGRRGIEMKYFRGYLAQGVGEEPAGEFGLCASAFYALADEAALTGVPVMVYIGEISGTSAFVIWGESDTPAAGFVPAGSFMGRTLWAQEEEEEEDR